MGSQVTNGRKLRRDSEALVRRRLPKRKKVEAG